MLDEILGYLKNWFVAEVRVDTFTVEGGHLALPWLKEGQYYRIIGSTFNDGVHWYGWETDLTDETFTGAVWALAIPRALLNLVKEIEAWQEKNGDIVASPYQSESFGGYSYSKKSDQSSDGTDGGWKKAFAKRLSQWRKI